MCALCGVPAHIPLTAEPPPPIEAVKFAALRNPECRGYLIGAMLSMMADNVEHVISYWVLWNTFHSPALMGFAVIAHWVPSLLFGVQFGALADRYDCRKVIQASQGLFMSVSVLWGLLFLTHSLQMWHAVALLILHGFASALWAPAEQLLLHDIVGIRELPSAVRLNSTFRSLGLLCGPAVGAGLLLGLGETNGIFANVLIYLPLTVWLVRVPYTGHSRADTRARGPRVALGDALPLLREVAGQPVLISMVALGGLTSFFIGNAVQAQMPEFSQDLVGADSGFIYGALLAANAAGSVLGGLWLEGTGLLKPNARAAVFSALIWSGCMFAFAISGSYVVSLALLVVAGVANLACQSISQTLVQLLAPADKRGRVIGLYSMSSNGLRAGSGVTIGLLGGLIGIHWSLALSASVMAVSAGLLLVYVTRTRPAARIDQVGGESERETAAA